MDFSFIKLTTRIPGTSSLELDLVEVATVLSLSDR
jgi:hypothetical protein